MAAIALQRGGDYLNDRLRSRDQVTCLSDRVRGPVTCSRVKILQPADQPMTLLKLSFLTTSDFFIYI